MTPGRFHSVLLSIALIAFAVPIGAQPVLIEPIALPRAVEQGVDMVYIDQEINGGIRKRNARLDHSAFARYAGAPIDLLEPVNPAYADLRRGLLRYQLQWGGLPQFKITAGQTLKLGDENAGVTMLRERLGRPAGSRFDEALAEQVAAYQTLHGLEADGIVGGDVVASLNRGALHYQQVLMINMERARRLPAPGELKRHIIVDAGAATVSMYENGRMVDSMRAAVGTPQSQTPMMAALIRYAVVNPYWNVPPDLIIKSVAPRVVEQGVGYLSERKYEVFADWTEDAPQIDPSEVDWQAVKDGRLSLRVRRGPGAGNSMGDIKFMMPNKLGIYLHDTHDRTVFQKHDRWISNGCVRVEDAIRLATWLFGTMPSRDDPSIEKQVKMLDPVPVFVTYLTAEAKEGGAVFRSDPYQRDPAVLDHYFGDTRLLTAVETQ
jgi:murein L,D-transpeptidase YcbB/YkuD